MHPRQEQNDEHSHVRCSNNMTKRPSSCPDAIYLLHAFAFFLLRARPDYLPLRRPHLHRTFATDPLLYDLEAVVHHLGTPHGGHYIAFIRDTAGNWYRFNDAKVTAATSDQVLTSGAYVLSYAKRRGAGVA